MHFKTPSELKALLDELEPMMSAAGRDLSELDMKLSATGEAALARKGSIPELEALGIQEIVVTPKGSSESEGFQTLETIARELILG